MARNVERDNERELERRDKMMRAGFDLFAERGIENVSLKEIADKANVGIATLYNYYQNKTRLVVALSAHVWGIVWKEYYDSIDKEKFETLKFSQRVENYLDGIIGLYLKHPNILKFSGEYKTYISRQSIERVDVKEHLDALKPLDDIFHASYLEAKKEGSVRTDIPEQELYTTICITMLAMAERYASGIVWYMNDTSNYHNELNYLKEMILAWIKG